METTKKTRGGRSALASSEGFGVYGPNARIGVVEEVQLDAESGRPALLAVRAGLLGSWRVLVPVEEVQEVSARKGRIVLRSGGLLAGPRRG